jgi:hypothetical protein
MRVVAAVPACLQYLFLRVLLSTLLVAAIVSGGA